MLGLGWSELLLLSVVVLIVVGPKDLPMMLRNLGRAMGSIRRMSNEFRREIDKAIALDEVKEAQKAISDPLKQTSAEISREFNTLRNGRVEPSGKIKPSTSGKESVADEIRAKAGLPPAKKRADQPAEEASDKPRAIAGAPGGAVSKAPERRGPAPKKAAGKSRQSKAASTTAGPGTKAGGSGTKSGGARAKKSPASSGNAAEKSVRTSKKSAATARSKARPSSESSES